MIQSKNALIFAVLLPILALAALTTYKNFVVSTGKEVILPISGYDPRDLLSGHYLIYQIDYGVGEICSEKMAKRTAYICLEPKMFSYYEPEVCSKLIRGVCNYNRFEAGIEKYFVPEDKAKDLEAKIRSKTASVLLSLTDSGHTQVKDLLVNGQSLKNE